MPQVQDPFLAAPGSTEVVVAVRGVVDAGTAGRLGDLLTDLIDRRGVRSLVVDVEGLSFIDSAGIYVLVQAMKRVRAEGGDLALTGVTAGVHKVLDICGLTGVFDTAHARGRDRIADGGQPRRVAAD